MIRFSLSAVAIRARSFGPLAKTRAFRMTAEADEADSRLNISAEPL